MKKTKTIIAIDDDVSLCLLMEQILGEHYSIKTFSNGMEAMSWLADGNEADLVITDMMMTEINGLDLLENLKSSGLFRQIPVIIVSGVSDQLTKEMCIELGASSYLCKPFNPQALMNAVSQLLTTENSETTKLNYHVHHNFGS